MHIKTLNIVNDIINEKDKILKTNEAIISFRVENSKMVVRPPGAEAPGYSC